jgi:3-oxoacyl-[acyl-carrier-protein] synthase-3
LARYAQIVGWGKALPTRVMHNLEFERLFETSDQWIRERTGIVERRLAGPGETTGTLAAQAAREALAVANLDPRWVDFVIVATCTPDKLMPATAPMVQQAIGATNAAAVDVNAACAGFTYALVMANSMIAAGVYRHVLVIGADTLARWLDWEDRRVSILFGDGAGAVLLAASDEPTGLLAHQLGSDGSKADLLHIPAGGSAAPSTAETVAAKGHYIQMEGRAVFKFAVKAIVDSTRAVLDAAGMHVGDVDLFVPHQANARIIDAAAESVGLPKGRVFTNIERYGNTSAASIPIALCEAIEEGRLRPGDSVLMCGFGAGLTWGTAIFQWGVPLSAPATEPWRSLASSMNGRADRARAIARRAVAGVGA